MRTVLITLIAPERTVDLVVDADTPVAELLPNLLTAGSVASGGGPLEREWTVAVMGRQPIPANQTLEQAEVLDGAVLVLRRNVAAGDVAAAPLAAVSVGSPLALARELLNRAGAAPEARIASAATGRCVTVTVLSPKGGVGKTALSILLGELLCSIRSGECLALDGDSDFGSLGRLPPLAFDAAATAQDGGIFARLAQGTVTFSELDRRLWKLPGGLRVVPSPHDALAMAQTDRAAYTRVIGGLQRLADTLIVDSGTGLGQPGVQAAVLAADVLVLVCDPGPGTAALVASAGELLARSGRPIVVVVNRLGPRDEDLTGYDRQFPWAAALVGIPEDDCMSQALAGRLDVAAAPRRLTSAAVELLAILAGVCSPAA